MSDPEPAEVNVETAAERLMAARDAAWRAADSASLTPTERRRADQVARTLNAEIERILVHEMADRSKIYDDAATAMPALVEPLRETKREIENIRTTTHEIRKLLSAVDQALAIALRFGL